MAAFDGGGSIFSEPVLVVNQKAKLIEINNEYAIYDQNTRADRRGARGRAEQPEEGGAAADLARPVHDAQAAGRRHARACRS